jgi:hypothetical protein
MEFRQWLEADYYPGLKLFPFMTEEDPPNFRSIRRYKNMEDYVKAKSRGGRHTENAAKALISAPFNGKFVGKPEEVLEIIPNAIKIPAHTFPNGTRRPERSIAFVHVATTAPMNPNIPKYNKRRHRVLAFWQGGEETYTKDNLEYDRPVGGISFIGDYIDTVWVDPEFKGNPEVEIPSLYKALREFCKQRGVMGLEPGDDLTSKSFRIAQAKYDWKRAHEI